MKAPAKTVGALIIAVSLSLAFAGFAAAKSSPAASAKAVAKKAAEDSVASFMPGSDGQPASCEVKTDSGYYAKNKGYLASCATSDGTFQYFVLFNAAPPGALSVKAPYLESQLTTFCKAGHAYAAGKTGEVLEVFAGSGGKESTAKGLRDLLYAGLKKTSGLHTTFDIC